MSLQPNESRKTNETSSHEDGAIAGWAMIAGAMLGAAIGYVIHEALLGAILLGVPCWIIGALVDRSRR